MPARMLYVYTLSPLHCGTGQSVDVIDLPIARERVTSWPVVPGSSLKGPLKDLLQPPSDDSRHALWRSAFGPDTDHADDGAGALSFGDARLLCFPARSYTGSFAWLSCPLALRRWQRDHATSELSLDLPDIPPLLMDSILVSNGTRLTIGPKVLLEDLDLTAQESTPVTQISGMLSRIVFAEQAWRDEFQAKFAIVSDDVFTFLAETATEVVARVRLNSESKTADRGALWYEESVPPEALFSGPVLESKPVRGSTESHLSLLPEALTLQIGGHTTVGRGLVQLTLAGAAL